MPANLPPHYHVLEERLRRARGTQEKIAITEEMYALLPKHKGTDKMQADLKSRLAKLRKEPQGSKGGATRFTYHVEREGAGQVMLVGAPNSGKSSLLGRLTRANPEIADYPFTTRKPQPGMLDHLGVGIQLVDLPPLSLEHMESFVPQVARYGDCMLLIVDLSDDATLEGLGEVLEVLESAKIVAEHTDRRVAEEDRHPSLAYLPTLLVGTKADLDGAQERLEVILELYPDRWPSLTVSIEDPDSLARLSAAIYDQLRVLRVFSKVPGKPADMSRPYVLPRGATVEEFALRVHKDFAKGLAFARVWGEGKFDGQRVNREYALQEGDVVELHR